MDMERNYDHSPYSWLIKEESSTRQEIVLGDDAHHVGSANYSGGRYYVFAPAVLLSRLFAKRWKVKIEFRNFQTYRCDDESFESQIVVNPWERATLTKARDDTYEIEIYHFRDYGPTPSRVYVFSKAAIASIEAYLSPLEANLQRNVFDVKEVIRSGKHDQLNWQKPLAKLTAYFTGERVGNGTFEEHRIAISVMFDKYAHIEGICCDRPHVSILDADYDLKTKALTTTSQSCPSLLTPGKFDYQKFLLIDDINTLSETLFAHNVVVPPAEELYEFLKTNPTDPFAIIRNDRGIQVLDLNDLEYTAGVLNQALIDHANPIQ